MAAFSLLLAVIAGIARCSADQSCEQKRSVMANWWNTFASMTWPNQWRTPWTVDPRVDAPDPLHALPVYLHKNKETEDRVLMLTSDARQVDAHVYRNYRLVGRRFCISPTGTALTPSPVYVYRKKIRHGKYDHLYTTDADEMGTTAVGERAKHGYRCLGTLGFVSNVDHRHYGLVPVYRWYSRKHKAHLYSRDKGLGRRLGGGFEREALLGYTLQCRPF